MLERPLIFLDLETTGTRTTRDRITEIAALRVIDGRVVDRFVTLVNPEMAIPARIQTLTGISDAMVCHQPSFAALANDFFAWLGDDPLVAHNARFDYGFLRNAFERAGLRYRAEVICTLKLSRGLAPQERHHNLDALLARHGLSDYPRHRAEGDARAMLALWLRWLERHDPADIDRLLEAQRRQASLPAHLDPARLQDLPERPGVYIFRGESGAVLYVGKSVNLRSRVMSHFNSDHRSDREMRLKQQTHDLEWQETAGDLGAQLLEAHWIKTLMPIHNRRLRRRGRLVSWQWTPEDALPRLVDSDNLAPTASRALYGLFRNRKEARRALEHIAEQYQLCPRLLGLVAGHGRCFASQLGRCRGACHGGESLEAHHRRTAEALERLRIHHWPWPGAVAFGEMAGDGSRAWHIVDHWCYRGSVEQLSPDALAELDDRTPHFDVDTYKILRRFLDADDAGLEVHPLT